MATPSSLGVRLREVRTTAEIPASRLSLAADVARDVVRQIEEGEIQSPRTDVTARIADVLGVSLEWLVHGRGPGPGVQDLEAARDRVARLTTAKRTGTEG